MRSMTSPLKETAAIACPTALQVEGEPQGLRLAWIDFGLCLLAPM